MSKPRKKTIWIILVTILILMFIPAIFIHAATPVVTPTSTQDNSYVRIRNVATSLYIDSNNYTPVYDGDEASYDLTADEAFTWLLESNKVNKQQQWQLMGNDNDFAIKNRANGLYLDVLYHYGKSTDELNGSKVFQSIGVGAQSMEWTKELIGNNTRLKNLDTGMYLDGYNAAGENDGYLHQCTANSSKSQQWTIE
jgi:uncharacterized protein YxeA